MNCDLGTPPRHSVLRADLSTAAALVQEGGVCSSHGCAPGGQGVIGRMVWQENQLVLATQQQTARGREEREGGTGKGRSVLGT